MVWLCRWPRHHVGTIKNDVRIKVASRNIACYTWCSAAVSSKPPFNPASSRRCRLALGSCRS